MRAGREDAPSETPVAALPRRAVRRGWRSTEGAPRRHRPRHTRRTPHAAEAQSHLQGFRVGAQVLNPQKFARGGKGEGLYFVFVRGAIFPECRYLRCGVRGWLCLPASSPRSSYPPPHVHAAVPTPSPRNKQKLPVPPVRVLAAAPTRAAGQTRAHWQWIVHGGGTANAALVPVSADCGRLASAPATTTLAVPSLVGSVDIAMYSNSGTGGSDSTPVLSAFVPSGAAVAERRSTMHGTARASRPREMSSASRYAPRRSRPRPEMAAHGGGTDMAPPDASVAPAGPLVDATPARPSPRPHIGRMPAQRC